MFVQHFKGSAVNLIQRELQDAKRSLNSVTGEKATAEQQKRDTDQRVKDLQVCGGVQWNSYNADTYPSEQEKCPDYWGVRISGVRHM